LILTHAQTDSIVTGALIRHIDYLLSTSGVSESDSRLAERAGQVDAALRGVLAHGTMPAGPNTAQFKAIIAKPGKKGDKGR